METTGLDYKSNVESCGCRGLKKIAAFGSKQMYLTKISKSRPKKPMQVFQKDKWAKTPDNEGETSSYFISSKKIRASGLEAARPLMVIFN